MKFLIIFVWFFDILLIMMLGVGVDPCFQSKIAFDEYKLLVKNYPNAEFYLAGHSLGGRLVQDVLYNTYDENDGVLGMWKKGIKTPKHSATFNSLGYNKAIFALLKNSIVDDVENKLNNYYYKNDLVGDGFGASAVFKRMGVDFGPWIAMKNGKVIDITNESMFKTAGFSFETIHGINIFCDDSILLSKHKIY